MPGFTSIAKGIKLEENGIPLLEVARAINLVLNLPEDSLPIKVYMRKNKPTRRTLRNSKETRLAGEEGDPNLVQSN